MQNDGYTVLRASRLPDCPAFRWVHFCWGSDIEFFGKDPAHAPEHAPLIRGLLSRCGFLMADCRRDLRQAVEWGFQGEVLGDFPAFGGFDPDLVGTLQSIPPADRKVILVKGREGGLVGRAFVVLAALQTIPRAHLEGFHIQIVMSSPEVSAVCRYLREFTGLDCHVAPRLPYRELLGLFARSRIAISASDVDGTPSFLVEAMAAGAFPIHSDMESIREWVDPGQNGLVFPVADHRMLAEHIDRALRDDPMVIRAAEINRRTTLTRLNRSDIRERMQSCLSHIMQTPLGIGSRSNS
ncbi:glycosyltransferase [Oscillatoria amoena NRMC-F 0135]|nr:glycosyltransferase [Oscillatoria amoena NRMC-F 0135]